MKKPHPNLFDILFVILILILAATAYFLSHRDTAVAAETVTRSYVIEFANLQEEMADCLAVGDKVTDNVKNYDMGVVTDIEVKEHTISVTDEDAGLLRQTPVEGYVTLLVTVAAETVETASSVSTESGYLLKTGTSVSCTVGTLTAAGYILTMDR